MPGCSLASGMYAWYSTFTLARTTLSFCQTTLRTSMFSGIGFAIVVPAPILRMDPLPFASDTVTESVFVTGLPPAVSVIVISNLTLRGTRGGSGAAGGAGTGAVALAGVTGRA